MYGSLLKARWLYWACQFVGWGGIALLGWIMDTIQRISSPSIALKQDHYFLPLTCVAGLIITHLLRVIIKRGQWMEMSPSSIVLRYGTALLITTFFLSSLGTFLFATPSPSQNRTEIFTVALVANISLIGAWMAIYFLLHFYEAFHTAREERTMLKEAYTASQLEALRLQLNPHFLFNALNTIRALMPPSAQESREAVTKLAETLRVTLASSEEITIPLSGEISVVRDYLAIEKLRFGEHLEIVEEIDPLTWEAAIPPLVLLTIVENAIKHGVQHHEDGGKLTIYTRRRGDEILVSVISPGGVRSGESDVSFGIGLRNVRERLTLIFGEKTSAELIADSEKGTECNLRFPWISKTPTIKNEGMQS